MISASSLIFSLSIWTSSSPSTGPASSPAVVKNIAADTLSRCSRRDTVAYSTNAAAIVVSAQVMAVAPVSLRASRRAGGAHPAGGVGG